MATRKLEKYEGYGVLGMTVLEDCQNPTLSWILDGFVDNFDSKLRAVKTTWNQKIRTFYREVLSLSTKKHPIQTAYRIDDNGRFTGLIDRYFPNLDFAEMVALRRYVSEVDKVQQYYVGSPELEQLFKSRQYALERLKDYNLEEIISKLFEFYTRSPEADVFGAYYSGTHTVEIYLVPCIIFAMLIEEDALDMIIGTLAHELAHGFHHIGQDKDGHIWEKFQRAELPLIEGLAEYYTREFARSVETSNPSILHTFKKTAQFLPPQYRQYEQWGDSLSREAVYQAFIEIRRSGALGFDDFERGLGNTNIRLSSGS